MKLPNMNEFSPGVLGYGIRDLLIALSAQYGDRSALVKAIEMMGTIATTPDHKQRAKRAANVLIGMSESGLFDLASNKLTVLGQEILVEATSESAARLFGRHILQNLHGYELVDVVRLARDRGTDPSLKFIRETLRSRGYTVTTNEGNPSKLRQWLEESEVVDSHWNFDEDRLAQVGGLDSSLLKEFQSLSREQIVLLNRLREESMVHPADSWLDLSPVLDLIELEFGVGFLPEGSLRAKVIKPLKDSGWLDTKGTGQNQGGNAGQVRLLAKSLDLKADIPLPSEAGIPADLREKLSTPLDSLFADLASTNTHQKGIALELLALNLLIAIGLRPVAFRMRADDAAGVETDLTANAIHLQYSRWLVQCKNTPELKHEHIAREIGLATVLRSHVILMITTGTVAPRARKLADQAARQSHLQCLIIDKVLLKAFREKGAREVIAGLKRQAEHVLVLKKSQESVLL